MFAGEDDLDSVRLARAAVVLSPRARNPALPESLDRVLVKALSKDPDARFPDVRQFGERLTEVLYEIGSPVSGFRLGDVVRAVRRARPSTALERQALDQHREMIEDELDHLESVSCDEGAGVVPSPRRRRG